MKFQLKIHTLSAGLISGGCAHCGARSIVDALIAGGMLAVTIGWDLCVGIGWHLGVGICVGFCGEIP